jgi:4-hydroxybenzoate polyprenyltransferase
MMDCVAQKTASEKTATRNGATLRGLIRTMRPKQWHKNGFIFLPLLFDEKILNAYYLTRTLAGFALLCLISSAIYIVNDLADIEKDRLHPTKRRRPLASGQLAPGVATAAAVILVLVTLPLSFLLNPVFGLIVTGYLVLQLAYSFSLKHIVILDVLAVAAGFVLRVAAGVALVDVVRFSPWLYVLTTLLALFLGFGKRRHELLLLKEEAHGHRAILEEYNLPLLDEMISVVTATTVVAYSLYTFSAENLPADHTMMLTIPFVLYGIFRYLYLIHVRGEGGAPDEVALRDRPMQITLGLWGLACFLVLYADELRALLQRVFGA